ncbi:MAG: LON peptidase substrate-binding domain-containing protein [Caulobacter sp.]|jgi:Lon protease-like protein|nr:LON peptidase substrate-binding domain-containing protein [Caulobacter sp.]
MVTGYRKAVDLPQAVPVFPLDGATLLPGGQLPLNIFEPRYLNMIDDAMAGDRLIGMVQTRGGDPERPALAPIGCVGKITSFAETPDGRYMITLTGVCRFELGEELPVGSPYRQVRARFAAFEDDLRQHERPPVIDRPRFLKALGRYLDRRGLGIDWDTAGQAPADALVNSLAMGLPFAPAEKQALLEAVTIADRAQALIALLEIDSAGGDDEPRSMQ